MLFQMGLQMCLFVDDVIGHSPHKTCAEGMMEVIFIMLMISLRNASTNVIPCACIS